MEVVFQNHAGKALPLTQWPLMLQDEEKLLKVSRSYASTERRAEGITIDRWFKRSQEFSLTVAVFADSAGAFYDLLDALEAVTVADIAARKPGRLYVNGRSYLPASIAGFLFVLGVFKTVALDAPAALANAPAVGGITMVATAITNPFIGMIAGLLAKFIGL